MLMPRRVADMLLVVACALTLLLALLHPRVAVVVDADHFEEEDPEPPVLPPSDASSSFSDNGGGGDGGNPERPLYHIPLKNFKNTAFFGELTLGSSGSGQVMRVLYSTASADTWVFAADTHFELPPKHAAGDDDDGAEAEVRTRPGYNRSLSPTYRASHPPGSRYTISVGFGSGSLEAVGGHDTMTPAGVGGGPELADMPFGEITQVPLPFQHKFVGFDGVVGLSYEPPHNGAAGGGDGAHGSSEEDETVFTLEPEREPFFDRLLRKRWVHDKLFSLFLSSEPDGDASRLVLGGTDPQLYTGPLKYYPVTYPYHFWKLNLTAVTVQSGAASAASEVFANECDTAGGGGGGEPGGGNAGSCHAVFDSSATLITGPSRLLQPILKHIRVDTTCANFDRLPDISFHFNFVPYTLQPADYVLRIPIDTSASAEDANAPAASAGGGGAASKSSAPKYVCVLGIAALDMPQSMGEPFVLGTVFLRKFYSVYDRRYNRIGLATANQNWQMTAARNAAAAAKAAAEADAQRKKQQHTARAKRHRLKKHHQSLKHGHTRRKPKPKAKA